MSTTRIPRAQVDGLFGRVVTVLTRRMFGTTPDSIGVLWHHKQVFKDSMGFGRKVEAWDELDRNLATYATMAAAASIGCSFCLDLGYYSAHNDDLDLDKAREVPRWRESDLFSPLERDVLAYAEAMTVTPPEVTDELSARLLEQLGPAGLLELTAFIGAANLVSRMNTSLGIESQGFSAACGLPPMASPSRDLRSSA